MIETAPSGTAVRVVVCGEALIDLVPERPLGSLAPKLGGGPFNAAVTLGRLGTPTAFYSRVSTDPFGEQLIARLRESGASTELVQRGPEPTTIALTSLAADGSAEYAFYVGGTADRLVTDSGPLPDSVAAVSFGTLSLVLEPGATAYEQMMHRAHAAGRLTLLDPNIRPLAIGSGAAADAYRARFLSWLPSVDILKVSDDDAHWLGLGPAGSDPERWLREGVGAILFTRGGAGLSVLTDRGRVDVPAAAVTVVDTIGAGDTVHGAVLAWLDRAGLLSQQSVRRLDDEQWRKGLLFAAAAAGVTVSRPGADPPWARELAGD